MSLKENLLKRCENACELCQGTKNLSLYEIPPSQSANEETALILCDICLDQIVHSEKLDLMHFRCLESAIWSEHNAVKVMSYRILSSFKSEAWALDLLSQIYLDDAVLEFAKSGMKEDFNSEGTKPTLDSHGAQLLEGDSVTLIKDLEVKGGGFTAKRGTLVKNISLSNNPEHIEGKVNGIHIVLLTKFLKKA